MQPLKVGNIIAVDGDGVRVQVTAEDFVVEHEGDTYRIGQLGSYVTIPLNANILVGLATSIERHTHTSPDLEPPVILSIQLVGTIRNQVFHRGVNESPTVGDDVWAAAQKDFEAIFGTFDAMVAGSAHPCAFHVGRFASDTRFEVKALGREFFSKHIAIMGNSGSGKSCCTAKILQEVLELPQAQVVLFDLHGEYRTAFSDDDGQVLPNVTYVNERDLVLPYWLLRYEELDALFVDRNDPQHLTNQESFLKMALTEYRGRTAAALDLTDEFTVDTPIHYPLTQLKTYAENLNDARFILSSDKLAFTKLALRNQSVKEQHELMLTQRCEFKKGNAEGEVPHATYNNKLLGLINKLDTRLNDRRYDFVLKPIEQAQRSKWFRDVLRPDSTPAELSGALSHLIKLLTGRLEPRSNLTILDLSGVPFDMIDLTVAVITRILFDYNFWCPVEDRHPILLVFEEAHNYIPRKERAHSFARTAVERVAKEGRKYGVSAMIISQRPSELSETVLAQCNSMIILRLNNPDDQMYITKVVSDQFAALVRMLPVLRPGEGFVIGDAVLMPMRTLIDLPRRLPQSGNMDYFRHWSLDQPGGDTDAVIRRWWTQHRGRPDPKPAAAAPAEPDPAAPNDNELQEELVGAAPRRKAPVMAPRIRHVVK